MSDPLTDAANAISTSSPKVRAFAQLAAQRIIALEAKPAPPPSSTLYDEFRALQASKIPDLLGAAAVRIVPVTDAAGALAAIAELRAGDSVRFASGLTVPGRVMFTKALSAPAELLCNGATFTGVDISAGRWDTIYAGNAANVRLYDGAVTASANTGIRLYGGGGGVGFYRFSVSGTNGSGLLWNPINGDVLECDYVGDVHNCGKQAYVDQYDPHAEKGTGVHAIYLGGASGGKVRGPRIYAHIHDQPFGAGVEMNLTDHSANRHAEVAVYAERLTFAAKTQVAGNVIQAWGSNGGCDFPLLYGEDLQGRVFDTNTPTPDTAYSGMVVAKGRALRTNLNPALSSTEGNVAQGQPFDTRRGVVYRDVPK